MKIGFLDAATVDLGDLNLKRVQSQGDYHAVPRCPGGRLPRHLRDAEVLISNKVRLGGTQMDQCPYLRLICVAATGVNNIDLEAAQARGIGVCNVAGYSTTTVVEHTLMFVLAFSHRLLENDGAVKQGKWSRSPFFTLLEFPFHDLQGKTLGVVGYGHIGRRVAHLAKALGMEVLVAKLPGRRYAGTTPRTTLAALLRKSDFVSLNCPLSDLTRGLINRERLALMKAPAYLINMARGPVVVEQDVVRALKRGKLAGYGADVTATEPIPRGHPFLQKSLRSKILLTPHVAWASRESRQRLVDEIGENIAAFRKGRRRSRVV